MNLVVGGMGCRRCVREVTSRLRDVPGVETATADAANGWIALGGTMTPLDVLAAFEGTSFLPTIVGDPIADLSG
jgi:copper chaperone CopZ